MAKKKPTRSKTSSAKAKSTKAKSRKPAAKKKPVTKLKLKRAGGVKRPGGDGDSTNPPIEK